jgi:hypothetical protein
VKLIESRFELAMLECFSRTLYTISALRKKVQLPKMKGLTQRFFQITNSDLVINLTTLVHDAKVDIKLTVHDATVIT